MSYDKKRNGILYCKTCGFAFGGGEGLFTIPKSIEKGKCPICECGLFSAKGDDTNFSAKIEKSMPTWEDVFRNKYITKKKIILDNEWSFKRHEYEQNLYRSETNKLKQRITTHIQLSPTVECPYCHSKITKKITNTTKVVNTVVWGIFGTKRHKNYHCNDCKSDF